jgi:hypothetical protein
MLLEVLASSLRERQDRWGPRQGISAPGTCKSAEMRQRPTTWLTHVRLHISGDNTPPPSKKCRRNSLYKRLGAWSPTAVRWRPRLPAIRRAVGVARILALKHERYAQFGELYNEIEPARGANQNSVIRRSVPDARGLPHPRRLV